MRGKADPKVLIAGAGPVGLASAITLMNRNVPVEVVERDDRTGTHSYALALHPDTLGFLDHHGLKQHLEENSVAVNKMRFCDYDGLRHELDLTSDNQHSGLLVVGQDHLEEALLQPLEKNGVPVRWSHRLSGLRQDNEGVELELESLSEGMSGYAMARLEWQVDRELSRRSSYLIGADGHLSMVRRALGNEFPKIATTQSFAVFEFRTDFKMDESVHVVFGKEGTSVLWPLPGGYCRWGFEINESAAEAHSRDKDRLFVQVGSHGYQSLKAEMLKEMIERRAPWFDGSIGNFRWRMIVRFEKRLVEGFGQGNIWLAGDSAHLAPPIGMQSMNIGITEGVDLANRMADMIEGHGDSMLLEDYGRSRESEWQQLMGLKARLVVSSKTDPFLAQYAGRLLGCLPASSATLPGFAKRLGLELETS